MFRVLNSLEGTDSIHRNESSIFLAVPPYIPPLWYFPLLFQLDCFKMGLTNSNLLFSEFF